MTLPASASTFPNMRAWCARFPKPIACVAMLLVANGRSIGSLTKRIFKAKADGWSPLARNPEEWLGLYRSQAVLMERIRTIEIADPSIGVLFRFIDSLRALTTIQEADPAGAERVFSECLDSVFALLHETAKDPDDDKGATGESSQRLAEDSPGLLAMMFFLTITMPCLVQFKTSPARLLTRARRGDKDAIRDLLQLDDVAISDPRISKQVYAQQDGPTAMRKAMTTVPKVASDDQWKARMASAIHTMAEEMQVEMRYQDIMDLFHAVATDCDGSRRGDESISFIDPRSFERKANRERKFWE